MPFIIFDSLTLSSLNQVLLGFKNNVFHWFKMIISGLSFPAFSADSMICVATRSFAFSYFMNHFFFIFVKGGLY